MEFKVYQASFVLNEFHRQATDVIDPPPPTIWKTVSGNPIQILDAVESPMQKCEVTLEPIQSGSGDPSPANVRPITGWTGISVSQNSGNLITSTPITKSGLVPNSSGTFNNSSTYTLYIFPVKKGVNINFWCSSSVNGYITSTDTSAIVSTTPQVLSRVALSQDHYPIEKGPTGDFLVVAVQNETDLDNICISYQGDQANYNRGTTTTYSVTTYEPYTSTVYGGTYDFVSGDGDNDMIEFVFDGTEYWGKNGNYGYYLDDAQFQLLSDDAPISNYCVGYAPGSGSGLNTWSLRLNTSKASLLVKPDTAVYDTTEKWKAYLANNPLQVVFKRNESIPFTSTPQQVSTNAGENNVWGDGTIELTYLGLE